MTARRAVPTPPTAALWERPADRRCALALHFVAAAARTLPEALCAQLYRAAWFDGAHHKTLALLAEDDADAE